MRVQQRKRNLQRYDTISITPAERPRGTPRQALEAGDITAKKICTTVSCAVHERGYKPSTNLNLARNRLCSELQQTQSKEDRALEEQAEKLRLKAAEQEAGRKVDEQQESFLMEELFEGDFSWDKEWEDMNDH
ncbi:hypothetical protein AC578_3765 [Pseudocercospora eumusae]|uniref:Uncharacterized protein n=1 Tax=Pseudocercospora eumusae TaxID=321146 RepID=A0A139HAL0_9PEZI|nr:hypothetical protein AC578_3765 [Pseudocercospora eumusae]